MKRLADTGKVRYWALMISVLGHVAALAVFTGIRLSSRPAVSAAVHGDVSLQMIEKAVEPPAPAPKPKPKVTPVETVVEPEKPQPAAPLIAAEPAVEPTEPVDPVPVEPAVHPVEFFGQKSIVQRIAYVVDCSGSMYGQMYRVRDELKRSVFSLNARQAFCVLFFTEGRQVLRTADQLQTADTAAKADALTLINAIRPAGSTDAAHALDTAMRLRDADGRAPQVIYFLTDGFDLNDDGALQFVEKIESLRNILAPDVVLHTIGFWPQENDRKMLDVLAGLTGGRYTEVN